MSVISVPLRRPVRPRDPGERGRAATPLELLFDLVFVVAIASNATELHHGISEGHYGTVGGYLMAFFAIWWAWMNYTWFASAYDNDDVVFRLLTFVIMTGALLLAAGVPDLFETGQSGVLVLGYAVMRFGMVGMWLRAARGDLEHRRTALAYAGGIAAVQVLWILRLAVPESWVVWTFVALVLAELAVPVLAERRGGVTTFHPHHIAERYGLMTIIVLGEVILSSVLAVQGALPVTEQAGAGGHTAPFAQEVAGSARQLVPLAVGGLLVVLSLWWLYFSRETAALVEHPRSLWAFGYGHYVVFAAVAAVGSALAAAVDVVSGESRAGSRGVLLALAFSVALATLTIAALHVLCDEGRLASAAPGVLAAAGAVLVALLGLPVEVSVLLVGLLLAGAVGWRVAADRTVAPA